MPEDQLYFVRNRDLPYPVFDSDNHMYEISDALTKFLPPQYEGLVRIVAEGNRHKLALKDRITTAPDPTWFRVVTPGGQAADPEHRRSFESLDEFFELEPRYKLIKEFGLSATLMWPTVGNYIEQALPDDPQAVHALIHAVNEWMYEHWTFGYQNSIFPTPVIPMAIIPKAIAELEWCIERGAKIVHFRPAPVHSFGGTRSWALPEYDPIWEIMQENDVVVGLHNTVQPRYPVDLGELEGTRENGGYWQRPGAVGANSAGLTPAFQALAPPRAAVADLIASMIGHGMLTRFPKLKVAVVEFFEAEWTRSMVDRFERAYAETPSLFDEEPMKVLRRNLWIHIFRDPNPVEIIRKIGVDNCMFGSDFPHQEGMQDPLAFSEQITDLTPEEQAKVMGGNLAKIMGVDLVKA